MITEYHAHEMATISERCYWNALKFGQAGEVNSKEREAPIEGWFLAPPICNDVGTPQGELEGAVGDALIQQPAMQCPRTKLGFDVFFDDQFFD